MSVRDRLKIGAAFDRHEAEGVTAPRRAPHGHFMRTLEHRLTDHGRLERQEVARLSTDRQRDGLSVQEPDPPHDEQHVDTSAVPDSGVGQRALASLHPVEGHRVGDVKERAVGVFEQSRQGRGPIADRPSLLVDPPQCRRVDELATPGHASAGNEFDCCCA
jgi:hypothetical protein